MTEALKLDGIVPVELAPKRRRIFLQDYDLPIDIGFTPPEIGKPQRVVVSIEVWVSEEWFAAEDRAEVAWDYDVLRTEVGRIAASRRFNLQETLAREIYELIAARAGVEALRVTVRKPDIYPDCAAVGVELASF